MHSLIHGQQKDVLNPLFMLIDVPYKYNQTTIQYQHHVGLLSSAIFKVQQI